MSFMIMNATLPTTSNSGCLVFSGTVGCNPGTLSPNQRFLCLIQVFSPSNKAITNACFFFSFCYLESHTPNSEVIVPGMNSFLSRRALIMLSAVHPFISPTQYLLSSSVYHPWHQRCRWDGDSSHAEKSPGRV